MGVGAYILTLIVVRRSRDLDRYRYLLLLGRGRPHAVAAHPPLRRPSAPRARRAVGAHRADQRPAGGAGQAGAVHLLRLVLRREARAAVGPDLPASATASSSTPGPSGPSCVAWGFAMLVLGAEGDIGFALLIFVLFIAMLWLATGRVALRRPRPRPVRRRAPSWPATSSPRWTCGWQNWLHPGAASTSRRIRSAGRASTAWAPAASLGTGLGFGHSAACSADHPRGADSDYIFAAFGTEMGLLGTTVIVFAFILLVGAGLRIAQTARSEFAKLLAAGLTVIIGMQAFFIMAGIVRLLPLTGITLPFMAYGGSSLVANYVLIALLMRISDEGERAIVAAQATATAGGRRRAAAAGARRRRLTDAGRLARPVRAQPARWRSRWRGPRAGCTLTSGASAPVEDPVGHEDGVGMRWRRTRAMASEGRHGDDLAAPRAHRVELGEEAAARAGP